MNTTYRSDINQALRIVGAEDFSDDGESGVVIVEGLFATAIMTEMVTDPGTRACMGIEGQPVRISRMGGLEIWCNGFYSEGRGVRRVVHRAVRAIQQ